MEQAFPAASLLRDFGLWLQSWSEFALAQAAQGEASAPAQPVALPATPTSPPEHWLEATRSPGPPEHWLALLREHELAWQPETGITALSEPAEAQVVTAVPLPNEAQKTVAQVILPVAETGNLPPASPLTHWLAQLQQETAKLLTAITGEQPASSGSTPAPQPVRLSAEKVAAPPVELATPEPPAQSALSPALDRPPAPSTQPLNAKSSEALAIEPAVGSETIQRPQPEPLRPTAVSASPSLNLQKPAQFVTNMAVTPAAEKKVETTPDDGSTPDDVRQPTAAMSQAAQSSQPTVRKVTRLRFSTPLERSIESAPTPASPVQPPPLEKQATAPTVHGASPVRMTQLRLRPVQGPPTRHATPAAQAFIQQTEVALPETKASVANGVTQSARLMAIDPPDPSKAAVQAPFTQPTAPDLVLLARVEQLLNQINALQNSLKVANNGNDSGQNPPPVGNLSGAVGVQVAADRWPTLPEAVPSPLSAAPAPRTQRQWHQPGRQQARRQRLDQEQRGQVWNG